MALLVIDEMLAEHVAAALHRPADYLAVQRMRIDDVADIVDHQIIENLHVAGAGVNRHMDGGRAVAVGRF